MNEALETKATDMTEKVMSTLRERINLALTLRGQSLRGFCTANEMSTSALSRIITQGENITVKTLCGIATALGMDGPYKLINPEIALEELRPKEQPEAGDD